MDRVHRVLLATGLALWAGLLATCAAEAQRRGGDDRPARFGRGWRDMERRFRRMDADGDGIITRDEFSGPAGLFRHLDGDDDGVVTEEELDAMRRAFEDDGAPKVGDLAPAFTLKSLDGKQTFELTAFRGKRPVVLFFGSYT